MLEYTPDAFPNNKLTQDIDATVVLYKDTLLSFTDAVYDNWAWFFVAAPLFIVISIWWTYFYGNKIQPKYRYRWKLPSPKVSDPKWKKRLYRILRFFLYWWSRRLIR